MVLKCVVINYDGFTFSEVMREINHKVVAALFKAKSVSLKDVGQIGKFLHSNNPVLSSNTFQC